MKKYMAGDRKDSVCGKHHVLKRNQLMAHQLMFEYNKNGSNMLVVVGAGFATARETQERDYPCSRYLNRILEDAGHPSYTICQSDGEAALFRRRGFPAGPSYRSCDCKSGSFKEAIRQARSSEGARTLLKKTFRRCLEDLLEGSKPPKEDIKSRKKGRRSSNLLKEKKIYGGMDKNMANVSYHVSRR